MMLANNWETRAQTRHQLLPGKTISSRNGFHHFDSLPKGPSRQYSKPR